MSPPAIEVDDPPSSNIWNPTDWINCNKRYPSEDVPLFIQNAERRVLKVPMPYSSCIPQYGVAIIDFLDAKLPTQPSTLVSLNPAKAFSLQPPNEIDLVTFATRPIPSREWIAGLGKAWGQAWFDGNQSIQDPRFKDSRFPLWMLTFWKDMQEIVQKRARWLNSYQWFTRHASELAGDNAVLEMGVKQMLASLSWGQLLRALDTSASMDLLCLVLSDQWYNDDIIDMLLMNLRMRASRYSRLANVTIAPLILHRLLQTGFEKKDYSEKTVRYIHQYKRQILEGGRSILLLPTNKDNLHWIGFCVDFQQRTIRYGDPMFSETRLSQKNQPTKMLKVIQDWLRRDFGGPFEDKGNSIPRGRQTDGFMCEPALVNMYEHELFDVPLYTRETRRPLRMKRAHGWLGESRNIGLLSYVAVQVFEQSYQSSFRGIHQAKASLQTVSYEHLISDSFLCALPLDPNSIRSSPDGRTLELGPAALALFLELKGNLPKLIVWSQELARKRRNTNSRKK